MPVSATTTAPSSPSLSSSRSLTRIHRNCDQPRHPRRYRVSPLSRSSRRTSSKNDKRNSSDSSPTTILSFLRKRGKLLFLGFPFSPLFLGRWIKEEEKGGGVGSRCSRVRGRKGKGEGREKRGGKFYIRYSFASRYAFLPVFPRRYLPTPHSPFHGSPSIRWKTSPGRTRLANSLSGPSNPPSLSSCRAVHPPRSPRELEINLGKR